MPLRRAAFAPVVAALLLAGCVGREPAVDDAPPVTDLPDRPPLYGPAPSPTPGKGGIPGLLGLGGRGVALPASPTPTPPVPSNLPPLTGPPPATEPGSGPPASPTPPPSPRPDAPGPSGPPVGLLRFEAGDDAAPGRYVASFVLAPDRASFAASLRGVPEARVHVGSLLRLHNDGPVAREVRLAAAPEGPVDGVEEASIQLRDGAGAPVALLDLLAPGSAATLVLPAGSALVGSWTLALGAHPLESFSWFMLAEAPA